MQKIQTIFDRDWEGNRGVVDKTIVELPAGAVATEKLDGTNVRLTVRNNTLVRVEKRRNPSKLEKAKGIVDPWYVDASEYEAQDKWIMEAAKNTDLSEISDGEWSGEAIGPKIQGNPLNREGHTVCLLSVGNYTIIENVPTTFKELEMWLPKQKSSFYGKNCGIEGIVWWKDGKPIGKIKLKDFK